VTDHQLAPDAIVVGGGIIGCTLAYELQKRQINTLLLEHGKIGREASWATAGIMGPPSASGLPPHRAKLAEISHKRFPELLRAVEEDGGVPTSYLPIGKVLVARTEEEVELAHQQINWQINHGIEATWIEPDQVREIEPVIPNDQILGAYYSSEGGALTGHRWTESIAAAFHRLGGEMREHCPAISILTDGERVTGVDTPLGPISTRTVVLSAGAWTRFLGPAIGRNLPLIPYKGQMIGVVPRSAQDRPSHVVGNITGGYLVPRIDGSVAVGASLEDIGFDKRVTAFGLEYALGLIDRLGPGLRDAEIVSTWAGLRPGTADDTPIMGQVPGYDGLWISSGHHRTGIQLAPGSAVLVADSIASGRLEDDLRDFSPDRFSQDTSPG
jgi:glycine oxidase